MKAKVCLSGEKMRILVLTLDFPPETGGIQNLIYNLCSNFNNSQVRVIAPFHNRAKTFDKNIGFEVERIRTPAGFKRILILLCMLFKAISNILFKGVDVLVSSHIFITPVLYLLKKIFKKKYAVFVYGMELRNKKFRKFFSFGLQCADIIFVISDFTKQEVLGLGVKSDRVVKINPGIDDKKWKDVMEDISIISRYRIGGKRIILTVSRLEERYKGHDMVIRAMPLILSKLPDAIYVIAGDGCLKPYLEKLAKSVSVDDRVIFTGSVTDEELKALYKSCEVFVMASRDKEVDGGAEGFGIVFLEANIFGKPVIGGRSGGVPDAVLDEVTGLLVNPDNPMDIADGVVKLLTDKELSKRLGSTGKKRALDEFCWKNIAARFEVEINVRMMRRI